MQSPLFHRTFFSPRVSCSNHIFPLLCRLRMQKPQQYSYKLGEMSMLFNWQLKGKSMVKFLTSQSLEVLKPGTMLFLKNTHFLIKAILIKSLVHERICVCVCVNKFRKFSQIYFFISSLCGAITLYRINMHVLQALPFCLC